MLSVCRTVVRQPREIFTNESLMITALWCNIAKELKINPRVFLTPFTTPVAVSYMFMYSTMCRLSKNVHRWFISIPLGD